MKVYVASGSDERSVAADYMKRLRQAGIELTLDWNAVIEAHGGMTNRGLPEEARLKIARAEVGAVERADVFWLIVPQGPSCGCWVELGVAHTLSSFRPHTHVVASGDIHKSVFTSLADTCFPKHEDALAAIIGMKDHIVVNDEMRVDWQAQARKDPSRPGRGER